MLMNKYRPRRGRTEIQQLADNLVRAAEGQGFSREQMEAEIGGDIYAFIRASIDLQNADETARLKNEKGLP